MLRPELGWAVLQGWWHYSLAAGKEQQNSWEGEEEAEKSDRPSPQFDCCMRHPLPMSLGDIFPVHRKFLKKGVFRPIGTKSNF